MNPKVGGVMALALLLTGCASAVHAPPDPASLPISFAAAQPRGPALPFWNSFGDRLLLRYVAQARAANLDVAAAAARLAQARAIAAGSAAPLGPELDASVGATRARNSVDSVTPGQARNSRFFNAGFDASWEPDLFGRLNEETRAADREVNAAAFDLQALRVMAQAEAARLYYAVRTTQRRIEIIDRSAVAQADLASLVRSRAKAGLVPEGDALRAEALSAASRATASVLRGDLAASIAALAVIVGRTAVSIAPELASSVELPVAPTPLIGAPADLLTDRPDVRRDLARLQAADARAAARARERLPRLTLSATGGYGAGTVAGLIGPSSQVFSLGANLIAPFIDFGRRKSAVQQADAFADEREAMLQSTILTAVSEVERDAASLASRREEVDARTVEVQLDQAVASTIRQRYLNGLENFSAILDAERALLASTDSQVLARQSEINSAIALWKSVGGPEAPGSIYDAP